MISIPGTVTFPRAEAVREVARRVPGDRLVLETDAPVLAPQGHRGRRNEPAYLLETAASIAAIRSMDAQLLAAETTANAMRLFHLHEPVGAAVSVSGTRP
jgi:TatD DNase family protein